MSRPDSELHPSAEETKQKPPWVTLHREMFPEGSVCYTLFPDILEGRKRPETSFNKSLRSLFLGDWGEDSNALKELMGKHFSTIGDVLRLSNDELNAFASADDIGDYLKEYLEGLALTPHAQLLERVLGEKQNPVPLIGNKNLSMLWNKYLLISVKQHRAF